MAVLKRSLRRKNATGNYDTIRLESDSSIVYRPSGRTVEQDLAAYLPSTQSSDVVPKTLNHGKIVTGTTKIFAGLLDKIVELSTDSNSNETVLVNLTRKFIASITTSNYTGTDTIIFDGVDLDLIEYNYLTISSIFNILNVEIYDRTAKMSYTAPFTSNTRTLTASTVYPVTDIVIDRRYDKIVPESFKVVFNKLSGNGSTIKAFIEWTLKIIKY